MALDQHYLVIDFYVAIFDEVCRILDQDGLDVCVNLRSDLCCMAVRGLILGTKQTARITAIAKQRAGRNAILGTITHLDPDARDSPLLRLLVAGRHCLLLSATGWEDSVRLQRGTIRKGRMTSALCQPEPRHHRPHLADATVCRIDIKSRHKAVDAKAVLVKRRSSTAQDNGRFQIAQAS